MRRVQFRGGSWLELWLDWYGYKYDVVEFEPILLPRKAEELKFDEQPADEGGGEQTHG